MRRRLLLLSVLLFSSGCIIVRQVSETTHSALEPVTITTPVRVHLLDGSVAIFPRGVVVTSTDVTGSGTRHDLTRNRRTGVSAVPLDSVLGFESYQHRTNLPATIALSTLATAVGGAAAGALAVAIFGSCPTIYADSAGTPWLQAEAFSYSIAPLFEMRDVDAVYGRPDSAGIVWFELRNEALETHYINHLELLAVDHDRSERALPDAQGSPVVFGDVRAPRSARDAVGRDVLHLLARRDSSWYETAAARVRQRESVAYDDHVELTFAVPEARDSVALILNLRNSLLNTVLFYDIMLGNAGAHAVNWLGSTLEEIGEAAQVGRWYSERSGVRVSVLREGTYRLVARVPDAGPIAWKSVALMLPGDGRGEVHVRLEFLADSWRIDQAGLAVDARRGEQRVLPLTHVTHALAHQDRAAVERLREPDDSYFVTFPGTTARIGFHSAAEAPAAHMTTTYLLAAQGYYTEWVRRDWVRSTVAPEPFVPGDAALERAYRRWLVVRSAFEAEFFDRRIPVRTP